MDTLGYYGVLCCTVGALHGTAGYCWLLLGKGWYWGYWVVLWCTEVHWGVTRGTVEYCGVLQGTAGHCWVLPGTAWYYWLLGATRCIPGQGGVLGYCKVLWVLGGAVLRGRVRYCGLL